MPVTSHDFTLQHTDATLTAKLGIALAYLQQSPAAVAILELASLNGVRIGMNPWGTDHYGEFIDPGRDRYLPGEQMVLWNPDSASQIMENGTNGAIIGVQSAALGLLHELVHGIDPAVMAHMFDTIPAYRNWTEYTAIQYETMVARDLGEPTRENHKGLDIKAENPTTHTMPTGDGGLVWAQIGANGQEEYGSTYDRSPSDGSQQSCPAFGSTAANYPGNEHDYDPGNYPGNEHDNDPPGGGRDDPLQQDQPGEYDPLRVNPKPDEYLTTHHNTHGWDAAQLVGVAHPPLVDGFGLF